MTKAMAPAWESGEGHEPPWKGGGKGPGRQTVDRDADVDTEITQNDGSICTGKRDGGTRGSDLETQAAAPCPPPDPSVPRVCEKTAFSRAA